ncbi:DUF2958 domain-containing protein [Sphingobium sp. CR2-8]|uniref:DUF2958 domain-containing protein n=1 Tax=Sphingobium sp. CR2-8 TaxID=1306534 RepID=UPI002DC061F6|nr:DUF2958 domain-containing protein [Sphingobium sp. CR2-8]MEC3909722.1 DUF2958 domain-containing protein [Sphingobium sp. CR2-8]
MILLTPDLRYALRANAISSVAAQTRDMRFDPVPVVKFFNPLGAGTWLATELYGDDDTLFGLADLGFGCPEMGTFSLMEIQSIRLPFGLRIERDLGFSTPYSLSRWSEMARQTGSIIHAEQLLRSLAPGTVPDLPADPTI